MVGCLLALNIDVIFELPWLIFTLNFERQTHISGRDQGQDLMGHFIVIFQYTLTVSLP